MFEAGSASPVSNRIGSDGGSFATPDSDIASTVIAVRAATYP
jgi:hypothetical protein